MKTYCFRLYFLLKVIYPLQADQMRSSDNRATSCSTFTLHDLQYSTPYLGHLGFWKGVGMLAGMDNNGRTNIGRNSFLQRFLKSCLIFITLLSKKAFPCRYTLLMQTCFPDLESWSCLLSVQNSLFYISEDTSQSFTFWRGVKEHAIFRKKRTTWCHIFTNSLLVCTKKRFAN